MKQKKLKERGITLIALVLTIIILLILAGVTLKIVIDNNFIEKTITATDKYAISQYKEIIEIIKTSEHIKKQTDKLPNKLKDLVVEKLKEENWVTTIRTSEDEDSLEESQIQIITKDPYLLIAQIDDDGTITYLVEEIYDGEPYPKITLEQLALEGTQKEKIKIKVIAQVEKGKKTKKVETIELLNTREVKNYDEKNGVIFEVDKNDTYTFKATTDQGKTTSKKIVINIQGTTNTVTINVEPKTPRNTLKAGTQNGKETGEITVTINYIENEQGKYQKQYSLDGGKNWINTDKTTLQTPITQNTTIIGRYYDGKNSFNSETYNIQNVDNIAPTIENYEIEAQGTTITVKNVQAQDTASEGAIEGEHGAAGIEKILYSIDGTNYEEQNTFEINEAKQYTIYVKAIDKAGNETIKNNKTINAYQINYEATGGTVEPTNKIALENTIYGKLPTPTKEGHIFKGWYTEENGGTQIKENDKVTTNQTLYARWEVGIHTLTVKHYLENANDAGYTYQTEKDTTSSVSYGTNINFSDQKTTIENGTYKEGKLTENGETLTNITIKEDTIIYLYYTRNKYTLTLNKGSNIASVTGTGEYKVGQTVTINATLATITGHGVSWTNWTSSNTNLLANNSIKNATITMPAGNVTLTANASASANGYTVKFNANGGNVATTSKTVTYNSTYGDLPTPSKTGHNFEGWYTATSGGTQITKDTKVTITAEQTLFAHWNTANYTLTIKHYLENANDGNYTYQTGKDTTTSIAYNSNITLANFKTTITN